MCGFQISVTPSLFANVTYAENANFIQNWISLGGSLNYQSDPLFNYLENLPQSPSKQSLWKAYKSAAVSSSINETQQYLELSASSPPSLSLSFSLFCSLFFIGILG